MHGFDATTEHVDEDPFGKLLPFSAAPRTSD